MAKAGLPAFRPIDQKTPGDKIAVEVQLADGTQCLYLGLYVGCSPLEIGITNAAWVAHTGRKSEFFAKGKSDGSEVEPYPDGVVLYLPRWGSSVIDWPHAIPRKAV